MTQTAEELKPCPFCGGRFLGTGKRAGDRWEVFCVPCLSAGPSATDEADAREAWNTRTPAKEAKP